MRANLAIVTLAAMCPALSLSTSGYDDRLRRGPLERSRRDGKLKVPILEIWRQSHETYGSPRIHAAR